MQVTTSNQHQPQGHTKTHEPARHKVQGMQVTTSNKHEPQGDTSQQGTRTHQPGRHKVQGMQVTTSNQHQPQGHTKTHEPAGTRFKACR